MLLTASMLAVSGCFNLDGPASVSSLTDVVGTRLPGAQGLTIEDQNKIDDAMAGLCASGVYDRDKCAAHTVASAERRG